MRQYIFQVYTITTNKTSKKMTSFNFGEAYENNSNFGKLNPKKFSRNQYPTTPYLCNIKPPLPLHGVVEKIKTPTELMDFFFERISDKWDEISIPGIYQPTDVKSIYIPDEIYTYTSIFTNLPNGMSLMEEEVKNTFMWMCITNQLPGPNFNDEELPLQLKVIIQALNNNPVEIAYIKDSRIYWSTHCSIALGKLLGMGNIPVDTCVTPIRMHDDEKFLNTLYDVMRYVKHPTKQKWKELTKYYNEEHWLESTIDNCSVCVTGTNACGKSSIVGSTKVSEWGKLGGKDDKVEFSSAYIFRAIVTMMNNPGQGQDRSAVDNYLWRYILGAMKDKHDVFEIMKVLSRIDPSVIEFYKIFPSIFLIDTNENSHYSRMMSRGRSSDFIRGHIKEYNIMQNSVYLFVAILSGSPVFDINNYADIGESSMAAKEVLEKKTNRCIKKKSFNPNNYIVDLNTDFVYPTSVGIMK